MEQMRIPWVRGVGLFLSSVSVNAGFTNRKGMLSGGKLWHFNLRSPLLGGSEQA